MPDLWFCDCYVVAGVGGDEVVVFDVHIGLDRAAE